MKATTTDDELARLRTTIASRDGLLESRELQDNLRDEMERMLKWTDQRGRMAGALDGSPPPAVGAGGREPWRGVTSTLGELAPPAPPTKATAYSPRAAGARQLAPLEHAGAMAGASAAAAPAHGGRRTALPRERAPKQAGRREVSYVSDRPGHGSSGLSAAADVGPLELPPSIIPRPFHLLAEGSPSALGQRGAAGGGGAGARGHAAPLDVEWDVAAERLRTTVFPAAVPSGRRDVLLLERWMRTMLGRLHGRAEASVRARERASALDERALSSRASARRDGAHGADGAAPSAQRAAEALAAKAAEAASAAAGELEREEATLVSESHAVFTIAFHEVIRQVAVHTVERARLMSTIWLSYMHIFGRMRALHESATRRLQGLSELLRVELAHAEEDRDAAQARASQLEAALVRALAGGELSDELRQIAASLAAAGAPASEADAAAGAAAAASGGGGGGGGGADASESLVSRQAKEALRVAQQSRALANSKDTSQLASSSRPRPSRASFLSTGGSSTRSSISAPAAGGLSVAAAERGGGRRSARPSGNLSAQAEGSEASDDEADSVVPAIEVGIFDATVEPKLVHTELPATLASAAKDRAASLRDRSVACQTDAALEAGASGSLSLSQQQQLSRALGSPAVGLAAAAVQTDMSAAMVADAACQTVADARTLRERARHADRRSHALLSAKAGSGRKRRGSRAREEREDGDDSGSSVGGSSRGGGGSERGGESDSGSAAEEAEGGSDDEAARAAGAEAEALQQAAEAAEEAEQLRNTATTLAVPGLPIISVPPGETGGSPLGTPQRQALASGRLRAQHKGGAAGGGGRSKGGAAGGGKASQQRAREARAAAAESSTDLPAWVPPAFAHYAACIGSVLASFELEPRWLEIGELRAEIATFYQFVVTLPPPAVGAAAQAGDASPDGLASRRRRGNPVRRLLDEVERTCSLGLPRLLWRHCCTRYPLPQRALAQLLTLLYSTHWHASHGILSEAAAAGADPFGAEPSASRSTRHAARGAGRQPHGGARVDARVHTFARLCGMLGAQYDDGSCALVCKALVLLLPRSSIRRRLTAAEGDGSSAAYVGVDEPSASHLWRLHRLDDELGGAADAALRSHFDAGGTAEGTPHDRALLDAMAYLPLGEEEQSKLAAAVVAAEEHSTEVRTDVPAVGAAPAELSVRKLLVDAFLGLLLRAQHDTLKHRTASFSAAFHDAARFSNDALRDASRFVELVRAVDDTKPVEEAYEMFCEALHQSELLGEVEREAAWDFRVADDRDEQSRKIAPPGSVTDVGWIVTAHRHKLLPEHERAALEQLQAGPRGRQPGAKLSPSHTARHQHAPSPSPARGAGATTVPGVNGASRGTIVPDDAIEAGAYAGGGGLSALSAPLRSSASPTRPAGQQQHRQ